MWIQTKAALGFLDFAKNIKKETAKFKVEIKKLVLLSFLLPIDFGDPVL